MSNQSGYRGIVALVLAICASAGVVMLTGAALYHAISHNGDMSDHYAAVITGTLGVTVGSLAAYIGHTGAYKGDDTDKQEDESDA